MITKFSNDFKPKNGLNGGWNDSSAVNGMCDSSEDPGLVKHSYTLKTKIVKYLKRSWKAPKWTLCGNGLEVSQVS